MNDGVPDEAILTWHGVKEGMCKLKVTGLGERGNQHVPGVVCLLGHGAEQAERLVSVAGVEVGFNESVPGEGVCLGHFVEQLGGVVETAAARVELEKAVGGGEGGVQNAGFEEGDVELSPFAKRAADALQLHTHSFSTTPTITRPHVSLSPFIYTLA